MNSSKEKNRKLVVLLSFWNVAEPETFRQVFSSAHTDFQYVTTHPAYLSRVRAEQFGTHILRFTTRHGDGVTFAAPKLSYYRANYY